ncbi:hypothetical protein D3C76_1475700 [compost metagenome]
MFVVIDPATPSGTYNFEIGGHIKNMQYWDDNGFNAAARSGTYTVNLDNVSKRHRMNFKIVFDKHGELEGEFDITE